jgi:HlyD family secretion protein
MTRWPFGAVTLAASLLLLVALAGGDFVAWAQGEPRAAPARAAAPGPAGVGAPGRVEPASRIRRIGPPSGQGGRGWTGFSGRRALRGRKARSWRPSWTPRRGRQRWRARVERLRAQAKFAAHEAERAKHLLPTGAGGVAPADRARHGRRRRTA